MSAEPAKQPDLTVIVNPLPGFDGELTLENLHMLADKVRELDEQLRQERTNLRVSKLHEKKMEGDLRGKRLRIGELEADREEKALASPERPQVEALHACHASATRTAHDCDKEAGKQECRPKRIKALDHTERENAAVCIRKLKFRTCLAAVVGITYDPSWSNPRRNGTRECYNTFELCLRNTAKASGFAERVPQGWQPDIERVAEIAGVLPTQIEEWLS